MSKKILVIDDDEGILDALDAMLQSAGYDVETSQDGEVIEKLTKNSLPNLILLDVLLSGKDGREICAHLKKTALTKGIAVVMISADPSASKETSKCGADAFIAKPFEMSQLLDTIETFTAEEKYKRR